MREIWLFIKSAVKHYWNWLGCAGFTIIGVFSAYANKGNAWIVEASSVLAAFFLVLACFLTWRDEHRKVEELEAKLLALETSASIHPVQNIYFSAPAIPPKPEPLKHNVQCLGVKIHDLAVTISFQNVPIQGKPVAEFRNARLSVEYRRETTNEEWATIFPARWISDNQDQVSIGVSPLHAFLATYHPPADCKWKALISLENAPNDFSWNDRINGVTLPTDRLKVTAILIGEDNLSLKPIKGLLTLGNDGEASWTPTEE